MREKKAKLRGSPGNGEKTPVMAYGCLFCITGREERVAEQIRSVCPEVQTTTMRQLKYRTHNGEKCLEESLLLPSYVFFRGPAGLEPAAFPKQHLNPRAERGRKGLASAGRRFAVCTMALPAAGAAGRFPGLSGGGQSPDSVRTPEGSGGQRSPGGPAGPKRAGGSFLSGQGNFRMAGLRVGREAGRSIKIFSTETQFKKIAFDGI